jgi:NhaA family Na+:H+ antiporter
MALVRPLLPLARQHSAGRYGPRRRPWVSDERLYAILGRVIAHPVSDEGSGDTKDRQTLQVA